jgi:hypothetical protein
LLRFYLFFAFEILWRITNGHVPLAFRTPDPRLVRRSSRRCTIPHIARADRFAPQPAKVSGLLHLEQSLIVTPTPDFNPAVKSTLCVEDIAWGKDEG